MREKMAQTVVELTLSTLRDLLVEEVKFLSGVGGQVRDVQTKLRELQSYLEDVDRKKYEGSIVTEYTKQIRDLCYRIEDVVETHATDVVLQKSILNQIACWLCRCCATHEVGTEINSIQKDISDLTQKLMGSGFIKITPGKEISGGVDGKKTSPRTTYGLEVKKDFVGKEKDINLLVGELLNGGSSKANVVSIYGMGGLGKTTLAEKIFWDKKIRSGFEAFAWVCVSQDCKPNNVFQKLLEKLCQIDRRGESVPVEEVYEAMKNKKCLVVLDDLWELDHWRCLKPAFPIAEGGSKILITTRKEIVAKIGFFHSLDFLSKDEAWELIRKKAFPRTSPKDLREEPETFEPVGRQIVAKCGLLPLAISVIGGVLSQNNSLDHWEKVNNKIHLYLRGADDSEEGKIKQVLSLSYDDLPFHLKPCFLYLSRYQEDENIPANEVYSMWMAEGIVSPKDQDKEETLMDVAKRYLRELVGRSMVLVEIVDEILAPEEIQSCQLHDLVRDLCLAKSVEEEFSNLVDFRGGKRPSLSPSSSSGSLRRLAVYIDMNVDGVSLTGDSTQNLRSLSLHAPGGHLDIFKLPQGLINLENLKFLKVLKFYNVAFPKKKLLGGIENMVLLRYLGFESCSLDELPSCIGELPSLQTLDLNCVFYPLRMPNVLCKIKRLKCLYISDDVKVKGKLALSGLDELEILHGFDSRRCETTDLLKLKSLRRLKATIWKNEELSKFIDSIEADGMCLEETIVFIDGCDFTSVEGMSVLRKLFRSRNIHNLTLGRSVYIDKLPEYEPGFLPRLTSLELWKNEGFSEYPMGTLEKLPKLRKLTIFSYWGKKIVCNAEGFPQLRYLAFIVMPNLETWEVEEGAMPRLSSLRLVKCERLDMIPARIRFITSLQKLAIERMPREFVNRVKEGGEDYDKVRHINSIIIDPTDRWGWHVQDSDEQDSDEQL